MLLIVQVFAAVLCQVRWKGPAPRPSCFCFCAKSLVLRVQILLERADAATVLFSFLRKVVGLESTAAASSKLWSFRATKRTRARPKPGRLFLERPNNEYQHKRATQAETRLIAGHYLRAKRINKQITKQAFECSVVAVSGLGISMMEIGLESRKRQDHAVVG